MNPEQRYNWIENYLLWSSLGRKVNECCDVLDRDFVEAYVEATGAKVIVMPFGADKCAQLGRDLGTLFRAGRLQRWANGIWGGSGEGFPRWVYTYHLPRVSK